MIAVKAAKLIAENFPELVEGENLFAEILPAVNGEIVVALVSGATVRSIRTVAYQNLDVFVYGEAPLEEKYELCKRLVRFLVASKSEEVSAFFLRNAPQVYAYTTSGHAEVRAGLVAVHKV